MNKKSLKEIADELMKVNGNTKGSEFLTLSSFIEAKYGKEGLEKLENKMEELGYPCRFKELRPAHWYRESLNVLAIIVAKDLFGWEDLFDFGYNSPVFSFGVKIFIKFLPLSLFVSQIPKIWKKFLDIGSLEVSQLNEKEKYLVLRLKGYMLHPDMCRYFAGFFLRMEEFLIRSKKVTIEETKCIYRGDSFHEYLVKWE